MLPVATVRLRHPAEQESRAVRHGKTARLSPCHPAVLRRAKWSARRLASYHFSVHANVSRGKGQSLVRTAAYNARARLADERTGEVWDYRQRGGLLMEAIYVPKDAPDWSRDLQRLVNEIERVEKRSDAQLAMNLDIALPHELTLEQNRRLIGDFVREEFSRKGYVAHVAIHAPDRDGDQRNIHAHVLVSLRTIGADGFAKTKAEQQDNYRNRSTYVEELREKWERLGNRHLERYGHEPSLDRRSLRERGIDREPEQHRGPKITGMERRGEPTRIGEEITRRQALDAERQNLAAEARQIEAQIIDLQAERAKREARTAPQEARPQPERGRGADEDRPAARGRYAPLERPEAAPEAKPERALSGTAAELRVAWSLSRTASELEDALSVRGISLAVVSPEEAYASERRAALAKEAGSFAPVWRDGEIVAVDGRGVYRLSERTTGDARPEIEGRLAGIDRAALMTVADTQEAMRAASWASRQAERQADREQARAASWIESRIADCADRAVLSGAVIQQDAEGRRLTGADALADRLKPDGERTSTAGMVYGADAFAARLEDAGIALARVTEADRLALDTLRRDAEMSGETGKGHRFAEVEPGELAAVTRDGDVYRIDPAKLGAAAQMVPESLPSVVEARAAFEIDRERTSTLWSERRAEGATLSEAFAADHEQRAADANAGRAEREAVAEIETAIEQTDRAVTRAASGVAKIVADFLGGVFDFFAGGSPKLTPQQAELAARANEEKAEARAQETARQEKEAAVDWLLFEQNRQRQYEDLRKGRLGRNTPREVDRDDDLGRER